MRICCGECVCKQIGPPSSSDTFVRNSQRNPIISTFPYAITHNVVCVRERTSNNCTHVNSVNCSCMSVMLFNTCPGCDCWGGGLELLEEIVCMENSRKAIVVDVKRHECYSKPSLNGRRGRFRKLQLVW
ncbi:hypothetical protein CEXT_624371 [Caerostris extrusa]|uniref:Uncharacterized protein n=1 Tax=Caerostris extrusa TaxID=172846 RepID=A0AAV4TGL7_CAEEX|nr:hypothetical protein CEXT_624371 [Caerostris extrusa]